MTDRSEQQFASMVAAYTAPLHRLARAYVAERADREDLMQDIWLALWQALPRFRGECTERTFIYRVAHNRAATFRRRVRRSWQGGEDSDALVDERSDPAGDATQSDLSERLSHAVRALAEPYREAVVLHLEGLSTTEIAGVQGTSAGNVAVRLSRARDALRAQFSAAKPEST